MTSNIISNKLKTYNFSNISQEIHAIREICQYVALYKLSKDGFFANAAFMGGTCLHLLHGVERYSEDLDFSSLEVAPNFDWITYTDSIKEIFASQEIIVDVIDKSKLDSAVKKVFIKENSFGKLLTFHDRSKVRNLKKFMLKLEIDTNPPEGANTTVLDINYPGFAAILCHDLPTLFSGKIAALLCRKYTKGRDWFDFIWYLENKIVPNYNFLSNALKQQKFLSDNIKVDKDWLSDKLLKKAHETDWRSAITEIETFIDSQFITVEHWGVDYFSRLIEKLNKYL